MQKVQFQTNYNDDGSTPPATEAETDAAREHPEHLLTESQLAARWQISPKTLRNWRAAGKEPPFVKVYGLVRYRPSDIFAIEERCLVSPGPRARAVTTVNSQVVRC